MLFGVELVVPLVVVMGAIALAYLRFRRRWPAARLVFLGVLIAYLTVVASYVFFPVRTDDEFIAAMRARSDWWSGVNLVPFVGFPAIGLSQQFLGNVLLGVPFGLGAPFVVGRPGRVVVVMGLAFAVGIEAVQLLINVLYGFSYRFVDVNDAILNFAGVLLGLAVFYVLRFVYGAIYGPGDPESYFDQVLTRPTRPRSETPSSARA